ncbi:MAG: hypothetical protein FWD71_05250 [Oscillospiraceae bacterium]|nr:hypothetical protein [Oscillospiraceae bacterium]
MDIEISRKIKDIIQKYASGLFKNSMLEYFGIKSARVKELINVDIQLIKTRAAHTRDFNREFAA